MCFSTHPGDQIGLLRSCASKTTSSLAEALQDLKPSVCLVWPWSACTRSISPCVFVLLRAGHAHWLSPSVRSREGQALQDTQHVCCAEAVQTHMLEGDKLVNLQPSLGMEICSILARQ